MRQFDHDSWDNTPKLLRQTLELAYTGTFIPAVSLPKVCPGSSPWTQTHKYYEDLRTAALLWPLVLKVLKYFGGTRRITLTLFAMLRAVWNNREPSSVFLSQSPSFHSAHHHDHHRRVRYYYFGRGSGCEVLWWVCLSVYLSVCLRRYLRNHTCDLYQTFCAHCLCPCLGPPLARWR